MGNCSARRNNHDERPESAMALGMPVASFNATRALNPIVFFAISSLRAPFPEPFWMFLDLGAIAPRFGQTTLAAAGSISFAEILVQSNMAFQSEWTSFTQRRWTKGCDFFSPQEFVCTIEYHPNNYINVGCWLVTPPQPNQGGWLIKWLLKNHSWEMGNLTNNKSNDY